jgi:hypothetical protein
MAQSAVVRDYRALEVDDGGRTVSLPGEKLAALLSSPRLEEFAGSRRATIPIAPLQCRLCRDLPGEPSRCRGE